MQRGHADLATSTGDALQLLVFLLTGRRFAMHAANVLEVQRMVALVPLPGAPEIVDGVFDLRGQLVPVMDTRQRFGLPSKQIDPDDHLVIATAGSRTVALRVDAALGLSEVPGDRVDTAASDLPGVVHVDGVAQDDEGLIVIHDVARFLSLEEGQRLDSALAGRGDP